MLPAFVFYTFLFVALVVVPAALILVALLFLEHERRLWRRITPAIGPIGRMLARSSAVAGVGARFPRTLGFLAHRLEPRDPWGLQATLAGAVIFAGVWFFLGVLQDIVAKDPLVVLDIRLHNAVPLFRTPGMTRFMLLLTELGGATVLSLAVLGVALLALARGRPRLAATFMLALGGIAGATALIAAVGLAFVLSGRAKIVQIEPPVAIHALDMETLRASLPHDLPRWSEDLIGGRMEPISLVLIGSLNDIVDAFTRAGWTRADLPTPARVLQEGIDAIRDLPEPAGPATPAFFMDRPQSLTFEKPEAGSPSIRRRHHTRLWQTLHCLAPNCRPIWVATASFDVGIKFVQGLYFVTHRIDPALDDERTLIVADLMSVGVTHAGIVAVSPPLHAENAAGDPFWTDGRAVVLVMP